MKSIADLKKLFEQKASGSGGGGEFNNRYYLFWSMDFDTTATVRLLPDANEDSPTGFFVENLTHTLLVNGQKRKVPCLSMYGKPCPCCDVARDYYDKKDETNGKRYYKKREYLPQVAVRNSPFEYDAGENPVKLISMGTKLFKAVQNGFLSGDLEEVPYSFKGGYDFRITKTKQGEYADYSMSRFAPKQSDLDDSVIDSLQLYDLSKVRTREITAEEMEALILADQTGGNYTDNKSTTSTTSQSTKHSDDDDAPFVPDTAPQKSASAAPVEKEPEKPAASSSTASDILKRIREKANAAG